MTEDYKPQEPISQLRGTDPMTGYEYLYQVDANNFVVARFENDAWLSYLDHGEFQTPTDLKAAISKADAGQGLSDLQNSGHIKIFTEYITVGDEPPGGNLVLDLRPSIPVSDLDKLSQVLQVMPRQFFFEWFDKNVLQSLPDTVYSTAYGDKVAAKEGGSILWAGFIDLFNEVNLKYCNDHQISPWDWEQDKAKAYFASQNKDQIQSLKQKFIDYEKDFDWEARQIMANYATLPKLGDLGLEISRQFSIAEFIKRKEYDLAQVVIDSYRNANETIIGEALKGPVPANVTVDGQEIKQTPNS